MLKAIKDTMRAWLLAHEKLYWFIVVGLAFTAFLLITLFGFGKLVRAEAAVDISCDLNGVSGTYTVYDIRECDWSEWAVSDEALKKYSSPSTLCDKIVDECEYMIVTYDGTYYWYYFGSTPFTLSNGKVYENYSYVPYCSVESYYSKNYSVGVMLNDGNPVVYSVGGLENLDDFHTLDRSQEIFYKTRNMKMLGSNYDIFEGYTDSYFEEVKAGVPYNNLTLSSDVPDVPSEGYDKLGFVPQIISGCHLEKGWWYYTYSPSVGVVNGSGELVNPYMRVSYRIKLPSAELVQSWVDNGYSIYDFENNDIVLWRSSGAGTRIEVIDYYPSITCDSGYLPMDVRQNIEDAWQHVYGDIDISALDMVCLFAYPDVMVTSSYYDDFGTAVYGDVLVQKASSFSDDACGVYYNDRHYLHGKGHCSSIATYLESVQKDLDYEHELEDWLKEETYKSALEENERLKKQVESLRQQLASMGSSDGDLWDTFDDMVNALKKASDSFVNIGYIIGNVFSFLPIEVTGMMVFVFTSLLVIAVYWALRGK